MGQLPDNAPEEQLAVIRRFSEEHSGAGLRLINLPRLGYTLTQPPRRRASPGTALGGPGGRGTSSHNPAVSGTALGQAFMAPAAPAAPTRPAPPPTDVPPTIVRMLPPSQRPPRHWAIPLAASRYPARRKSTSAGTPPLKVPGGQKRMEARIEPPGDTEVQTELVDPSSCGPPPVHLGPPDRPLSRIPSLRLS